ncbi:MAG: DUF1214 domain-containing protein [Gammaproteobacteria bacterium]|nr:DUF1214 domain-containing protein [Gammaproteobacteria bacterium]
MSRTRLAVWYALALSAGLASAWLWLTRVGPSGVDAGVWRVNLLAGSPNADAYTRARVALGALLALDRRETLYYIARTDERGEPLRANCRYRLEGPVPAARWWSVTAYDEDFFLFENAARRYSVNVDTAPRDAAGQMVFDVGPEDVGPEDVSPEATTIAPPDLPTRGEGTLLLTLRLYNPALSLQRDPAALAAPRITIVGDCP